MKDIVLLFRRQYIEFIIFFIRLDNGSRITLDKSRLIDLRFRYYEQYIDLVISEKPYYLIKWKNLPHENDTW